MWLLSEAAQTHTRRRIGVCLDSLACHGLRVHPVSKREHCSPVELRKCPTSLRTCAATRAPDDLPPHRRANPRRPERSPTPQTHGAPGGGAGCASRTRPAACRRGRSCTRAPALSALPHPQVCPSPAAASCSRDSAAMKVYRDAFLRSRLLLEPLCAKDRASAFIVCSVSRRSLLGHASKKMCRRKW